MKLPMAEPARPGRNGGRYWILAAGLVLAALAGYLGYVLYPRFDLPAGVGAGLLGLAAFAGVAAFFSPCSFPLLVTLMTREAGSVAGRGAVAGALRFAAPVSVGAAVFIMGLGSLIGLGGRELVGDITFTSTAGRVLRISVGSLLILLGVVQAGLVPISFHRMGDRIGRPLGRTATRARRRRPFLGLTLFGFFYLLAGVG